jgi:hypothetical protein
MAEQDWTPSKVTQGHLKSLMNPWRMTVMEPVACRVPDGPTFPTPAEGYVLTFVAFYEWEFGVPSQQFLCSLPRH